MLLAIDVGNTRIKFAVFNDNKMIHKASCLSIDCVSFLENLLEDFPTVNNTILASVGQLNNEVIILLKKFTKLFLVSDFHKFPFLNQYKTPNTLGIDRKVLVSGASLLYPKKNCLVIDAGTCITFDFIDNENNYLGGAISPGIGLRYKSLNNYTANLPLLEKSIPIFFIGNSTVNAIHSGVTLGVIMEINSQIERYVSEFKDLTIILTGGDTDFLAKSLKNTIFANSNFLLESLNELFTYKIKND